LRKNNRKVSERTSILALEIISDIASKTVSAAASEIE
jgi:hypothetical protein